MKGSGSLKSSYTLLVSLVFRDTVPTIRKWAMSQFPAGCFDPEVNKHNMRSMQLHRIIKDTSQACLLLQAPKEWPILRTRLQVYNAMFACIDITIQMQHHQLLLSR